MKSKPKLQNQVLPFAAAGGEKLLQFIWQFGYFNSSHLTTTAGEELSILVPGVWNQNGGPDFSSAKVKIGDTTLFGSIELHLKTSDWEKHQHQFDAHYRNVILHVVFQHDKELDHAIPVLELEPRISTLLLQRYDALMQADSFVPCSASLSSVKPLIWVAWKERLLVERLSRKAAQIAVLFNKSNQHWEETFWWLLARSFGMKVNGDAFEALAQSLPITMLGRHKASLYQTEALLFGQAGLLNETFDKNYPLLLQREYRFLQRKLLLQPVPVPLRFLRMRPSNFPTLRLAQMAALIQQSSHLFSTVVETECVKEAKNLFCVRAGDFWNTHYTFQQTSSYKEKCLGSEAIDSILINTVIPVLFAYGRYHGMPRYVEKALRWLEELAAERNALIRGFAGAGIKAVSAYDTQALIELKNEYCTARKCLSCAVGNFLLKRESLGSVLSSDAAKRSE